MTEFEKYATMHRGISSTTYAKYTSAINNSLTPTVKEFKKRDSYYSPICNIDLIGSFTTFENRYIFPACYYMVPSVNNLPRINKK